jgi:AcrR family transcriptional regulator
MQAIGQTPGLRKRKKIRTRQTVRREAFRLIEENGYAATTVEQIAEAAECRQARFSGASRPRNPCCSPTTWTP